LGWSGRPDLNRRPHAPQALRARFCPYLLVVLGMRQTAVRQRLALMESGARTATERYRKLSRVPTKVPTFCVRRLRAGYSNSRTAQCRDVTVVALLRPRECRNPQASASDRSGPRARRLIQPRDGLRWGNSLESAWLSRHRVTCLSLHQHTNTLTFAESATI
jgi:hypothetical protein